MVRDQAIRRRVSWIVIILSLALFATILTQHEKLRPVDLATSVIFKEFGLPYYYTFSFISFLGSIYVVPVVLIIILAVLWKRKKNREASILAVATLSNYLVVNIVKMLTDWSRPEEVQRAIEGTFPSAHASTPFVLYILAYLFLVKKHKVLPFVGIIVFALLIGVSRMVVNAHWLTDILAGELLAIAWISGTLLFYKK